MTGSDVELPGGTRGRPCPPARCTPACPWRALLAGTAQRRFAAEPFSRPPFTGVDYKTTTILLDGRRVKLQLW